MKKKHLPARKFKKKIIDRTDIDWLLRVQQDLKDSAFIMERLAKHFRDTTIKMERMFYEHEEILARDLRGSRRGNMDQETTKKQTV